MVSLSVANSGTQPILAEAKARFASCAIFKLPEYWGISRDFEDLNLRQAHSQHSTRPVPKESIHFPHKPLNTPICRNPSTSEQSFNHRCTLAPRRSKSRRSGLDTLSNRLTLHLDLRLGHPLLSTRLVRSVNEIHRSLQHDEHLDV
jgi:hypothetical protein